MTRADEPLVWQVPAVSRVPLAAPVPTDAEWSGFIRRLESRYDVRQVQVDNTHTKSTRRVSDFLDSATRSRIAYLLPTTPLCQGAADADDDVDDNSAGYVADRAILAVYFGPHMQGPSGGVHGGAVASVLDACIGMATNPLSQPEGYLTAQLTVNYRRMMPLGSYGVAWARVFERDDPSRKAYGIARLVDGQALLASRENGESHRLPVYAEASALFVRRKRAVEGASPASLTQRSRL
ncbi:hypothetical protein CDCA_CDCA05G1691 [Cyanidium caldarium]|uniref:Acyl-coenzyme A thioesterase THEM4 n=1 Tax=Cyanidium caldarium TaxID=2771 RepID=A0AAV9IU80_CYACA|nr:hypothetical protein CDCA_CDCA05G1691 [Cyanidium caldarium]|eukprot:ctg_110.g54